MAEQFAGITGEMDGCGVHGMRLARAITSQSLAAHSPADAGPQLLHALARYGEWAKQLGAELLHGTLSPFEAARQIDAFARIQSEAITGWMECHAPHPAAGLTEVSERDLDFLLAEEIECNPSFSAWLLEKTGGVGPVTHIARSVATVHGETDLLVVHGAPKRAMMIENKIAAAFQAFQAERYRKRGEAGVADGEWDNFCTVLIAPGRYLSDVASDAFDHLLAYEDIDSFLALMPPSPRIEFKRRIITQALGKSKSPWVKKVDADLTRFFADLREYVVTRYPALPYPPDKQPRAPASTWLLVTVGKYPGGRLTLELKPEGGHVDLHFSALPVEELRAILKGTLPDGATTVHFGKPGSPKASSAIRYIMQPMDIRAAFAGQEDVADAYAQKSDVLLRFYRENEALFSQGLA